VAGGRERDCCGYAYDTLCLSTSGLNIQRSTLTRTTRVPVPVWALVRPATRLHPLSSLSHVHPSIVHVPLNPAVLPDVPTKGLRVIVAFVCTDVVGPQWPLSRSVRATSALRSCVLYSTQPRGETMTPPSRLTAS
jgi:hypothetical protein